MPEIDPTEHEIAELGPKIKDVDDPDDGVDPLTGAPLRGLWGGVVLLGEAPTNQTGAAWGRPSRQVARCAITRSSRSSASASSAAAMMWSSWLCTPPGDIRPIR